MNKTIADIKERIRAIEFSGYIEIPYLENGIYRTIKIKYNEAKKLALREIEENL